MLKIARGSPCQNRATSVPGPPRALTGKEPAAGREIEVGIVPWPRSGGGPGTFAAHPATSPAQRLGPNVLLPLVELPANRPDRLVQVSPTTRPPCFPAAGDRVGRHVVNWQVDDRGGSRPDRLAGPPPDARVGDRCQGSLHIERPIVERPITNLNDTRAADRPSTRANRDKLWCYNKPSSVPGITCN